MRKQWAVADVHSNQMHVYHVYPSKTLARLVCWWYSETYSNNFYVVWMG